MKGQMDDSIAVPSKVGASTPGPWEVQEADLAGLEFFIVPAGYRYDIAGGVIEGHTEHTVETQRANARLIALAPELAEALREYGVHKGNCDQDKQACDCGMSQILAKLEAA